MTIFLDILLPVYVLGITTSLYPCLFPLLPSFLVLIMHTEDNRTKGIIAASFLTLGILAVFIALGLIVKLSLFGLSDFLINNIVVLNEFLAVIILLIILLLLIGPERIPFINMAPQISHNFISKTKEDSMVTAFVMGLFYTLIAAPCSFPNFIAMLSFILPLDNFSALLLHNVNGKGAGTPFLKLGGMVPEAKNTVFKQYERLAPKVKYISIFILFILFLYFVDNYYFAYNPLIIHITSFNIFYRGLGQLFWQSFLTIFFGGLILILVVGFLIFYISFRWKTYTKEEPEKIQ